MADLTVHPAHSLQGTLTVPGDKSVSHRALLTGAIAAGATRIRNLLNADDVRTTRQALQDLGVRIFNEGEIVVVEGRGPGGLQAPAASLQMGNSGTTARLLLGILAGCPFRSTLAGDESLSRRPMRRVAEPLERMGAVIASAEGAKQSPERNEIASSSAKDRWRTPRNDVADHLPLTIQGGRLRGIRYEMPVASAQVKSAILYAGLAADGPTTVVEPVPTRDHTERMLRHFGAKLTVSAHITVHPGLLTAREMTVPGDFSSAAFFLAAAAIVRGSSVTIRGVGLNPTRTAFLGVLKRMGAKMSVIPAQAGIKVKTDPRLRGDDNKNEEEWEPVGDVTVRYAPLKAVTVAPEEIPGLIDELPILMVTATQADGTTVIERAGELRVKETDRIRSMVDGLTNLGARIRSEGDMVIIEGPAPLKGGAVDSRGDHRTAMALAVAGLAARGATTVREAEWIRISFPGFSEALNSIRR